MTRSHVSAAAARLLPVLGTRFGVLLHVLIAPATILRVADPRTVAPFVAAGPCVVASALLLALGDAKDFLWAVAALCFSRCSSFSSSSRCDSSRAAQRLRFCMYTPFSSGMYSLLLQVVNVYLFIAGGRSLWRWQRDRRASRHGHRGCRLVVVVININLLAPLQGGGCR